MRAIDATEPFLRAPALDGHAEHVGDRLEEVDLVSREHPPAPAMGAQGAVGAFRGGDDHAHRAHDLFTEQPRQRGEACFRRRVLDDHRAVAEDGVSGLGATALHRRSPHDPFLPADARSQEELVAAREHLGDVAVIDAESPGHPRDRAVQHLLQGRGAQGVLPQLGGFRVEASQPADLVLRPFPLGDVPDRADSPHGATVRVELDLRLLSHPFQVAANDDAVRDVVRGSAQGGGPCLIDGFPVLGVHEIEEGLVGQGRAPGDSEDAKHFIGPGESIAGDVQMPAPEVRDLLRSVQVGLALAQRFLGLLARGDVTRRGEDSDHPSPAVPVDRGVVQDRREASVAMAKLQGVVAHEACVKHLAIAGPGLLRVGEVVREVRADQRRARMAGGRLGGRIHVGDPPVRADGHQRVQGGLDQAPVVCAGQPQGLFRALALGHVVDHRAAHQVVPVGIGDRRRADEHGQDRAVLADQIELDIANRALGLQSRELGLEGADAPRREEIRELHLPDHVVARISQPFELGIVDPDEHAVLVEGVIAAGRVVVEIADHVRRSLQGLLRLLARGDVVHGAAHEHDVAIGIALHFTAARDRAPGPVGRHQLQIQLVRGPRPPGLLHRRVQSGKALRGIEAGVLVVAGGRQLRIAANDTAQLFRPGDLVGPWLPPPAAHSGEALRLSEFLLPPVQSVFRSSTFDVGAIDEESHRHREGSQQGDHGHDHQGAPGPLGGETRGQGVPPQGANQDGNDDGRGQQPPDECSTDTGADQQGRDPPFGARTEHAEREQTQGDRGLQRDVSVGGGGLENEIEEADDRGDSRHTGKDLGGRIPARSPRDRPVQPEQREPQEEKIQGGDRRHQAWTNAANRVRGGFLEQQLIDPQVPADHVLGQAQQAHRRGDGRQQLSAERPGSGDGAIVHFPHQPQRETDQHQADGGVGLDDHLTRDDGSSGWECETSSPRAPALRRRRTPRW